MTRYEFYLSERERFDRMINTAHAKRYSESYLDILYAQRKHVAQRVDECERLIIDHAKGVTPVT